MRRSASRSRARGAATRRMCSSSTATEPTGSGSHPRPRSLVPPPRSKPTSWRPSRARRDGVVARPTHSVPYLFTRSGRCARPQGQRPSEDGPVRLSRPTPDRGRHDYDHRSRLTGSTGPDGPSVYAYDPLTASAWPTRSQGLPSRSTTPTGSARSARSPTPAVPSQVPTARTTGATSPTKRARATSPSASPPSPPTGPGSLTSGPATTTRATDGLRAGT